METMKIYPEKIVPPWIERDKKRDVEGDIKRWRERERERERDRE